MVRQIAWVSIWHGLALSTSLSSLSYNDRGDLPLRALRSKRFCDGSHAAELPIEKASTTWPAADTVEAVLAVAHQLPLRGNSL